MDATFAGRFMSITLQLIPNGTGRQREGV